MKKMALLAGLAVMLTGIGLAVAGDPQPADKAAEAQVVKRQTLCPIMGGPVNTNLFVDAEGKRVYFCCPMCVSQFKKDPAKYIAKLETEGVTLDKAPAAPPAQK